MKKIPFIKPVFPDIALIEQDLESIYRNGIYTNCGPFEKRFREMVSAYISPEVDTCLVANATLGLMMAIRQLFHPERKKVLIQSFTFSAGAQAILWSGHEPVFLDIKLLDWQADLEAAGRYLDLAGDDVAGIVACNTFGAPNREIGRWEALAASHGLPLIVDSAAGFGSEYQDGLKMGARGDCEIFSFHATKPFGIGEGGAIVSKNEEFISRMEQMKNFSFDDRGESRFIGLNAKLSEMAAAIGVRVFADFEERLSARRILLGRYKEGLKENIFDFQLFDELSTIPFFSVLLPGDQDRITGELLNRGVEVRNYYNPPLHRQPLYAGFETVSDMSNTEEVCGRILSLPVHAALGGDDIQMICGIMTASYSSSGGKKT